MCNFMDNKNHFGKSPVSHAISMLCLEDLVVELIAKDPALYDVLKTSVTSDKFDYAELESKVLKQHISTELKFNSDKSKPLSKDTLVAYDTDAKSYVPIDYEQQFMQLPNDSYTGNPDDMPHELGTDENNTKSNKPLIAFYGAPNMCTVQPWPIKGRLHVEYSSENINPSERLITWLNNYQGIYFTNVNDELILWNSAIINYKKVSVLLNGFYPVTYDDFLSQQHQLYPKEMGKPKAARTIVDQKVNKPFNGYNYVESDKKVKDTQNYYTNNCDANDYETIDYETIDLDYDKYKSIKNEDCTDYYKKYSDIKENNPYGEVKSDKLIDLHIKVSDNEIMLNDLMLRLEFLTKRVEMLEAELKKEKAKKAGTITKPAIIPRKIRTQ